MNGPNHKSNISTTCGIPKIKGAGPMKRYSLFLISSLTVCAALTAPAFSQRLLGYTSLGVPAKLGQIYSAPNTATNKIYVTDSTVPGVVTVVDGGTRAVFTNITVGPGESQVVADPITNAIYAFSGQAQTISVINGSTDTVTATIPPVVSDDCLAGIALDTAANQLAVLDPCSKSAYLLDGTTYSLLSTVSVPLSNMVDFKINPATHILYVVDSIDHEFVAANLATSASATINLGTSWPQSLDIDSTLNRVYMADNILNSIYVFDGATNVLLATVKPPTDPYSVAVNQTNHEVAVSDGFETLYFYNPSSFALSGKVAFPSPTTILAFSVNSATNQYYVGVFPPNVLTFVAGPR
jgi:DNA-binding beta-propeller fold protein YncE